MKAWLSKMWTAWLEYRALVAHKRYVDAYSKFLNASVKAYGSDRPVRYRKG